MSPPAPTAKQTPPASPAKPLSMDAEIAELFTKISPPDNNKYPSHELLVANEFIKRHPEYEKTRTEVYVSYVRVYEQMRKEGKLAPATPVAPQSILVRKAPVAKPAPKVAAAPVAPAKAPTTPPAKKAPPKAISQFSKKLIPLIPKKVLNQDSQKAVIIERHYDLLRTQSYEMLIKDFDLPRGEIFTRSELKRIEKYPCSTLRKVPCLTPEQIEKNRKAVEDKKAPPAESKTQSK